MEDVSSSQSAACLHPLILCLLTNCVEDLCGIKLQKILCRIIQHFVGFTIRLDRLRCCGYGAKVSAQDLTEPP